MDGNAQRAQLAGQVLMLLAAWVLESWLLLAATAVILGVGALWWPAGALFVQIHDRMVAPRLPAVPPIDPRPARFSAALGAFTLAGVAMLIASGSPIAGWTVVIGTVAAMTAEIVVGRCAPCELFVWAARRDLVPLARPLVGR